MALPSPTPLVATLPVHPPFVAPEEIERAMGGTFLLRLGANESAFGPSPAALRAASGFNAAHYGDPKSAELRTALAGYHGLDASGILVAAGIDELLLLFCRAFAAPGDAVVTTDGTYPTFGFGASGAGNVVRRVPYRRGLPDLDALLGAAAGAKVAYLANPDNPTGGILAPEAVERFARDLPEGCLLLLDEAYADFAEGLPRIEAENVVRLRTFSKAHGLAGLRVGYALGHPDHLAALDKVRLHFNVNGPAQAAALASLGDPTHLATVVRETAAGRARLAEIGRRRGLRPQPSATNFVLFDVGGPERATALVEELARRRVFVRRSASGGLRVTVGQPEDLDLFETLLGETLATLAGAQNV